MCGGGERERRFTKAFNASSAQSYLTIFEVFVSYTHGQGTVHNHSHVLVRVYQLVYTLTIQGPGMCLLLLYHMICLKQILQLGNE
jgi:hypothetical protein